MRVVVLIVLAFFVSAEIAYTQQYQQVSQYMLNPYLSNPAMAGAEDFIDIKSGYRKQWAGLEGAPTTFYVSGHTPIGKVYGARTHKGDYGNWHGVGAYLYADNAGALLGKNDQVRSAGFKRNGAYLSYAYNIQLSKGSGYGFSHKDGIRLSMGAFLGVQNHCIGCDNGFIFDNGPNGTQDAAVDEQIRSVNPDAALGMRFYFRELFYTDLAAFQIFANGNLSRHYLAAAGAKIEIINQGYLMPSVLIKTVGPAPVAIDLNCRFDYHDLFYAGLSYRNQDAFVMMAGVVIDRKYELAYSYDITLSDIKLYSSGSHEVVIGLRLPPPYVDRNADDFF